MRRFLPILAAATLFLIPAIAQSEPVQRQIPFSMRTNLVVPKAYNFRFSLIDSPSWGVDSLWQEEKRISLTTKKLRHVLGSVDPVGNPIDPAIFDRQLWVKVERWVARLEDWRVVGSPVMLTVVPYAFSSMSLPSASVTSVEILDGSVAGDDLAAGTVTDDKLATITAAGKVAASALPANVVMTDTDQTITGVKTFNPAVGNAPFAVDAAKNGMVANLYAARAGDSDALGGQTLTDLDVRFGVVPPSPAGSQEGYLKTNVAMVGGRSSITIGVDGLPVIAYYDSTSLDLRVLQCGNAACTSINANSPVDSTGNVGQFPSIAIGIDGFPIISYYDGTNGNLKAVHCLSAACVSWDTPLVIDATGDVGQFTSIAIDAEGHPVISYYDLTNADLKFAHCSSADCSTFDTPITLDYAGPGDAGRYTSIAIGYVGPVISYRNDTNKDLKVASCGDSQCANVAKIRLELVDAGSNVGLDTSITIGADGFPIVSYCNDLTGDLKVLHCGNADCSLGNDVTTVDATGDVGYGSSIAIGADGLAVVSYYDHDSPYVKLLHCGNAACTSGNTVHIVDSAGSAPQMFSSLTIGTDGQPVISYYDFVSGVLKVAKSFSRPIGRR